MSARISCKGRQGEARGGEEEEENAVLDWAQSDPALIHVALWFLGAQTLVLPRAKQRDCGP